MGGFKMNIKEQKDLSITLKLLNRSIEEKRFYSAKAWTEDILKILNKHIKEDIKK
jgi:hypothetical protein